MRILVVSNLYPPHYVGGYELACRDVVDGLTARGHEVRVLTSTYGTGIRNVRGGVHRWLRVDLEGSTPSSLKEIAWWVLRERRNQRALVRLCWRYRPELVYLWNLRGVSAWLGCVAQEFGVPTAYFVFDEWLANSKRDPWHLFWRRDAGGIVNRPAKRLARRMLPALGVRRAPVGPELDHVSFGSAYLKRAALQAGLPVSGSRVIHWGVNVERFTYRGDTRPVRRLLYVGQIVPTKGVHVAVEALNLLVREHGIEDATLTVVGGSVVPDYARRVRRLADSAELRGRVRFTGQVAREELKALYQEHDLLIFPSTWEEPFGITLLEAMATGCVVVATGTGGSPEIVEDEENALLFPKESAAECARQIARVVRSSDLGEGLRWRARKTIEEGFVWERTLDAIEKSILDAVGPGSVRDTPPMGR